MGDKLDIYFFQRFISSLNGTNNEAFPKKESSLWRQEVKVILIIS